jgi:hypothetical protein
MKSVRLMCIGLCVLALYSISSAAEWGTFRLLSLSESEKLILVSQPPAKTKYLLDASAAKITVEGKPAEYKALKVFSTIELKMEIRKLSKLGIDLDGVATEIRVVSGEKAK